LAVAPERGAPEARARSDTESALPQDLSSKKENPSSEEGFQRARQFEVIDGGKAKSRPPDSPEPSEAPDASPTEAKAQSPPSSPSIPSIQQLFELLRASTEQFSRWLGAAAYESAVRKQKRTSRFRKGALVDQKAE
jgi:hypothetical protein